MTMIVTVAAQKGGTGKTTLSAGIADAITRKGYSVLSLDLDSQGNLALVTGHEPGEAASRFLLFGDKVAVPVRLAGPDRAPWFGVWSNEMTRVAEFDARSKGADVVAGKIAALAAGSGADFMVVDTKPDTVLQLAACKAATLVIVPVVPEPLAVDAMIEQLRILAASGYSGEILLQPNQVRWGETVHRDGMATIEQQVDSRVTVGTPIPQRAAIVKSQNAGKLPSEMKGEGASDIAALFGMIAKFCIAIRAESISAGKVAL